MITEAQRRGMMSSESSEWATPRVLFEMLYREFRFDLDACAANAEMARCDRFISPDDNSMSEQWAWRRRVWVNPPYGRGIGDWVEKAYRSAVVIGSQEYCEHVVMLRRLGADAVEVRLPEQLEGLDGLVIPGGESTTMGKLMDTFGLTEPLRDWYSAADFEAAQKAVKSGH